MTYVNSIAAFLNKELRVSAFADSSRNGLQVRAALRIERVGFAVDACVSVFERAKSLGCDLIVVHHGIKWRGQRDSSGNRRRRVAYLKRHRMSLYACHLPLDAHPKYGNNIVLAHMIGLGRIEKFGRYNRAYIGYKGRLARPVSIRRLASILEKGLGGGCLALPYGKRLIRSVGIISGRGSSMFADAARERLDCFVTGEIVHESAVEARDARVSIVTGGHYATETVGVRALMPLLEERFGVETVFIDLPTPF